MTLFIAGAAVALLAVLAWLYWLFRDWHLPKN